MVEARRTRSCEGRATRAARRPGRKRARAEDVLVLKPLVKVDATAEIMLPRRARGGGCTVWPAASGPAYAPGLSSVPRMSSNWCSAVLPKPTWPPSAPVASSPTAIGVVFEFDEAVVGAIARAAGVSGVRADAWRIDVVVRVLHAHRVAMYCAHHVD